MHIEGESVIRVPRQNLYDFVLDPYQISQCIPRYQKVEVNSPDDFVVILEAASPLIKGSFVLHITVARTDSPEDAKFLAKGIGKGNKADLELTIHLEELEIASSLIKWKAEVRFEGRIAHVPSKKLSMEAEKFVGRLFSNLRVRLESRRI